MTNEQAKCGAILDAAAEFIKIGLDAAEQQSEGAQARVADLSARMQARRRVVLYLDPPEFVFQLAGFDESGQPTIIDVFRFAPTAAAPTIAPTLQ